MKKYGKICALVVVGMFVCMTLPMSAVAKPPPSILPFWNIDGNEAGPNDVLGTTNDEDLRIVTYGEQRMVVTADGNVAIGIAIPTEQLDVNGNIRASGHFIAGTTTMYGDGFIDLSTGTNLDIDSNTLYIDSTSNQVGIGTNIPGARLGVKSAFKNSEVVRIHSAGGGPLFRVLERSDGSAGIDLFDTNSNQRIILNANGDSYINGGNVGIGTVSPSEKLEVIGNTIITGSLSSASLATGPITASSGTFSGDLDAVDGTFTGDLDIVGYAEVGASLTSANLKTGSISAEDGTFVGDVITAGNVGIGTMSPSSKLDVVGDIHASGSIISGSSIAIDGTNDKITASSGTIDFDNENLVTTGRVGIGTESMLSELNIYRDQPYGTSIRISNPNTAAGASRGIIFGYTEGEYAAIHSRSENHPTVPDHLQIANNHGPGSVISFVTAGYQRMMIDDSGNVGIGTTNPQGALDITSTSGALIVPRMTTTQRNALTAVNGMIIYNTSTNQFNFYENGAWVTK